MDLKSVISDEEKTRHDALFYSQKPQNGYLSGEKARSLFIRSKLPLPDLSKIWKLADVSRNNMLDISEFAVAMHLIQSRLKGLNIPEKLPESLPPAPVPRIEVPPILPDERYAYEKAFSWKDKECTGFIDAEDACSILLGSYLPEPVLAKIWNLSDRDRDGKLSLEEFCVAIHLTRFRKKGNSLDGTVNVLSIIPEQWVEENFDGKKHRLAEVQTEKRKLLSLKEKLCHEIAGDVKEAAVAETIKTELYEVERQMYVLEKEEHDLRRTLQQFKDKSKKESFKPFDRSFILKRLRSGGDIFRGARKKNRAFIPSEKNLEIEKLWREDANLADFGVTIKEPPPVPVNCSIRQEQLVTIIELSQGQVSTESSAKSSGAESPLSNGFVEDGNANEDANGNSSETREQRVDSTENMATTHEDRERNQELRDRLRMEQSEGVTSMDTDSRSLLNDARPNDDLQRTLEKPAIDSTFSGYKSKQRNQTDDEKSAGSSNLEEMSRHHKLLAENGFEKETVQEEEKVDTKPLTLKSSNDFRPIPAAENEDVSTIQTTMAAVASKSDEFCTQFSDGSGSFSVETSANRDSEKLQESEVGREPLPRSLTQEELISLVQEEKRRKDEERAKQRRVNDEMLQRAHEEVLRQENEGRRLAEQRKATFEEERRKLEHQVSLTQGEEGKKGPVTRVEAGRIIEQELEEQRIREEVTRMELEKIKEKGKLELERQKLKQAKKEKQPLSFRNTDVVQKPVLEETMQLETEGLEPQEPKITAKRGSIVELNEAGEKSKAEVKDHGHIQPVMWKTNENTKPLASRKAQNRKSIVELEIERQKQREEEARREAEKARRSQTQRPSETSGRRILELETERQQQHEKCKPRNVERHLGKETSETNEFVEGKPVVRKQMEVDTIMEQRNVTVLESLPVDEIDARKKHDDGESQVERPAETEEEYVRQIQEKERKRMEAEKEELYRLRKEVDRKEAEELMRLKVAREEEKRKKREVELKEAAKREKENQEQRKKEELDAASRKTAFAAHKLILEKRVLKALEESKQEASMSKRRSSSFDRPTDMFTQTESDGGTEEDVSAAGVKLRRARFEKRGAQTKDLRKKRHSLNLDHARRAMVAREDVASGPSSSGEKDRASLYANDVVSRESQAQVETEAELSRRFGTKSLPSNGKLTKVKSLEDVSHERKQSGDTVPYMIVRDIPLTGDETDGGFFDPEDGLPVFADSRIQKELQEQRIREEVLRKEATQREKRYRVEEDKRKAREPCSLSGKKDVNLNEIKKNPLPNKIVVKKPQGSSNRDSLTYSMSAHWETVLQGGGDLKEKKDRKPSFIELEKERERLREEELQREREQVLIEKRRFEEEKEKEKQRKIQEELEKKRKAKEEKEKRQQRTLAMKSMFEKMGAKK